ncbi:MAG: hypothetical protein ACFFD2_24145, partial [Promethearchaeota archaeon]
PPDMLWGLNWSRAYTQINSQPNYNCHYEGNLLVINCTKYDLVDLSNGLSYNLTKTIIWDNTTGFLESLEIIRTYEKGLYQVTSGLSSQSSYTPPDSTALGIDLDDIFWIVAISVCGAAAALSFFVYYKITKRK